MGVGGQPHVPAASTPGKDSVPIIQKAGLAPGPVSTDGKSRPHREHTDFSVKKSIANGDIA